MISIGMRVGGEGEDPGEDNPTRRGAGKSTRSLALPLSLPRLSPLDPYTLPSAHSPLLLLRLSPAQHAQLPLPRAPSPMHSPPPPRPPVRTMMSTEVPANPRKAVR